MATPKVYIIILNYRQWEDTQDCLASVLRSGYENYAVLVVDNHSQNQSVEQLQYWLKSTYSGITSSVLERNELDFFHPEQLPKISFIQNDENRGFAAGNNLALRLLLHQDAYVWLLNPDMVVQENTLTELVRFAGQQASPCIAGATVRSFKGNQELLFYGGGKVNHFFATVRMVKKGSMIPRLDYISGACLFTHISRFDELGLLPEDYFLYWEETDWCHRAREKGVQLLVCQQAVCYDKISTVIGKSFLAYYYYTRNGLLFLSRFRRRYIPFALLFTGIRWLKQLLAGHGGRAQGIRKGAMDFLKQKRSEAE